MQRGKQILKLLLILKYKAIRNIVIFFLFPLILSAQNCPFSINGNISDQGTGLPLGRATLFLEENKEGTVADDEGNFLFKNICEGQYHIVASHIGCESKEFFIEVLRDTSLNLTLKHTAHELEGVVISANSKVITNQSVETISNQTITDNASKSLGLLIESIAGVSTLKNGNSIAKPVVHGNFGNRLTILNNGVAQSGQQWGNDHSPEIDPLVANKISVIKGVSALEYMGSNLGSVVLVEPNSIDKDPHLHGKATYFFDTNGLGNGANFQLQQYGKIGWKINATAKRSGDKKTSNSFLKNTGNQELNIALQAEKEFSENWKTDLYFSSFNTKIGVFRGTQATNLTSLREILNSEQRFSEEGFSYSIDAPRQEVNHNILKIHSKNYVAENSFFDITLAGQTNSRDEFDRRFSNLRDRPVLSLLNYNLFGEVKFQKRFINNLVLKTGLQLNFISNTNQPGTSTLPLIPDYSLFQTGIFGILRKKWSKNTAEIGFRYDNSTQDVIRVSRREIRKQIIFEEDKFNNLNGSISLKRKFSEHFSGTYSLGYSSRNPGINELYSFGVHQGVASFEEGNLDLKVEEGIKTTLDFKGDINEVFTIKALGYYQRINNYIFLEPLGTVLTIRGALPNFKYNQVDAEIFGFDFSSRWNVTESFFSSLKYAFIRGTNLSQNNIGIINLPSNNLKLAIGYQFSELVTVFGKNLENLELGINGQHVFKQDNISPDQELPLNVERTEFAPIPDAYTLFGATASANLQLGKNRLRIVMKADNLFNIAYRDYLNRQRYFADDVGINVSLGVSLKF